MYCYICKERDKASTYHIFPKDSDQRKKWLIAFRFEEDDIFKSTRVCGKHFEDSCFRDVDVIRSRKMLIKGSIPTLLLHKRRQKPTKRKQNLNDAAEEHPHKPITLLKMLNPEENALTFKLELPPLESTPISTEDKTEKNLLSDVGTSKSMIPGIEVESINVSELTVKQKRWRPAYVGQVNTKHGFDTTQRERRIFQLGAKKLQSYKHTIRMLQQTKRRLSNKIVHLESLVKLLREDINT